MDAVLPAVANLPRQIAPGKREPEVVEILIPRVRARHPDQGGRVVGQGAKTRLALLQGALALCQGRQQTIEAGNQGADFIVPLGDGQRL